MAENLFRARLQVDRIARRVHGFPGFVYGDNARGRRTHAFLIIRTADNDFSDRDTLSGSILHVSIRAKSKGNIVLFGTKNILAQVEILVKNNLTV